MKVIPAKAQWSLGGCLVCDAFSELRRIAVTGNRHGIERTAKHCELLGRSTVNLGGLTNQIHNAFIGFQIFRLKARNNAAEIVSAVGRIGMNRSRKEALAERAERHETDAFRF